MGSSTIWYSFGRNVPSTWFDFKKYRLLQISSSSDQTTNHILTKFSPIMHFGNNIAQEIILKDFVYQPLFMPKKSF